MLSADRPIDSIWPNDRNPRRNIRKDASFAGLVASIRSQGMIQPLLINFEGMILAGHRRYQAALEIGLLSVPVYELAAKNNHSLVPLIENLQRSDLGVLEVADYLQACRKQHDMTIPAIAAITGISEATIGKYVKLTDAPVELRERVERDEIPLNAAFELLRHDAAFIQEAVKEPRLTKQIVRDRASAAASQPSQERVMDVSRATKTVAPRYCPKDRIPHLKHAINVIRELLAAAPDDVFATRYKRWLNITEDDLHDAPDISTSFRGSIDSFQRQPAARPR